MQTLSIAEYNALVIKAEVKKMPKKIEQRLKAQAKKKGLKGDRANAYVYGTLSRIEKPNKKKK